MKEKENDLKKESKDNSESGKVMSNGLDTELKKIQRDMKKALKDLGVSPARKTTRKRKKK